MLYIEKTIPNLLVALQLNLIESISFMDKAKCQFYYIHVKVVRKITVTIK